MMCAGSPSVRELRRQHVESYGTLIPHVFMEDVLACVGRFVGSGTKDASAELRAVLEALENGIAHGDRETRSVIAISFASDARLETFYTHLQPYLGPRMRNALTQR